MAFDQIDVDDTPARMGNMLRPNNLWTTAQAKSYTKNSSMGGVWVTNKACRGTSCMYLVSKKEPTWDQTASVGMLAGNMRLSRA